MDMSDLYDYEIKAVAQVWQKLMVEFSKKTNTRANLDELSKRASDEFLKIGLVVEVDTTPTLIFNPNTMSYGSPVINVLGRVPGQQYEEDGHFLMDHERKMQEVRTAKERGEDFLGQKGS